jgi:hypothetical protein
MGQDKMKENVDCYTSEAICAQTDSPTLYAQTNRLICIYTQNSLILYAQMNSPISYMYNNSYRLYVIKLLYSETK